LYLGRFSRFLLEYVPDTISVIITRILGKYVRDKLYQVYDYVVYQRNPFLQATIVTFSQKQKFIAITCLTDILPSTTKWVLCYLVNIWTAFTTYISRTSVSLTNRIGWRNTLPYNLRSRLL